MTKERERESSHAMYPSMIRQGVAKEANAQEPPTLKLKRGTQEHKEVEHKHIPISAQNRGREEKRMATISRELILDIEVDH